MTSLGYVFCAHFNCFVIIIGNPGDLCDDCKEHGQGLQICDGCDYDGCDYDGKEEQE